MSRRALLTLVAVSGSALMIGMDFNGVAAVVTSIENDFGTDLSTTQWVLNLYALTFGIGIVPGGKIADLFGRRRVFAIGLVVFGVASLACGLAPNMLFLIVWRGVQGIGGALLWPTIVGIAYNAVPPEKSSFAMGITIGSAGFGNVLGPLLGGVFAEFVTWRLLLLVNVAICIVVGVMVARVVERDPGVGERPRLDYVGISLLSLGLFAALYALDVGADWGWTSVGVLGLFAAFVVLIAGFVIWERRAPEPLVPPHLLRDGRFVAALLANGLLMPLWFGGFLYLPQYQLKTLGFSAFLAGAGMLPLMVTFAALSPVAGRVYVYVGPRVLIVAGYVALTASAVSFAVVQVDWGYLGLVPGMVLLGIGAAAAISASGTAAVASVDASQSSMAGGLSFMVHLVMGAMGVAIATALLISASGGSSAADDFAAGFRAVMWFAAAVAALGILNSFFIVKEDMTLARGSSEAAAETAAEFSD